MRSTTPGSRETTVPIRPERPLARRPGRGRLAGLLAGLALAGCAQEAPLTGAPGEQSRRALADHREGAIRTVVRGNPFGMDQARLESLVTSAMADGVAGLDVRFTAYPGTAAAPEPHLVVLLNPLETATPDAVCAAPDSVRTLPAGETLSVLAVFCQGDQALDAVREEATVAGPTDRRFERLLWRTAGALFPDDYASTYGFGILPRWLNLGVGGSFGF
jgi:hypothetical protein